MTRTRKVLASLGLAAALIGAGNTATAPTADAYPSSCLWANGYHTVCFQDTTNGWAFYVAPYPWIGVSNI